MYKVLIIILLIFLPTRLLANDDQPASSSATKSRTNSITSDSVIAEVGDAYLTVNDFKREVKKQPDNLRSMANTSEGRLEILDSMVVREMILQEAKREGFDNNPELTEKLVDYKKRLIVESYLKSVIESKNLVSDDQLKNYYEQNKNKFITNNPIRASHILVKSDAFAKELLAQLRSGADFDKLAKKYSIDSSASRGGDLGWFVRGTMVPTFEEAAFTLKDNQISNVVKTDFGHHIIKLTGRQARRLSPYTEVREEIKAAILPSKQQEAFKEIKDKLKKKIKYSVDENVLNAL